MSRSRGGTYLGSNTLTNMKHQLIDSLKRMVQVKTVAESVENGDYLTTKETQIVLYNVNDVKVYNLAAVETRNRLIYQVQNNFSREAIRKTAEELMLQVEFILGETQHTLGEVSKYVVDYLSFCCYQDKENIELRQEYMTAQYLYYQCNQPSRLNLSRSVLDI